MLAASEVRNKCTRIPRTTHDGDAWSHKLFSKDIMNEWRSKSISIYKWYIMSAQASSWNNLLTTANDHCYLKLRLPLRNKKCEHEWYWPYHLVCEQVKENMSTISYLLYASLKWCVYFYFISASTFTLFLKSTSANYLPFRASCKDKPGIQWYKK